MRKFREWKYEKLTKTFLSDKAFFKSLDTEKYIYIDTREVIDFEKYRIEKSTQINKLKIKSEIESLGKDQWIILIHNLKNSNSHIASWARFNEYKKVRLFWLKDHYENKKYIIDHRD